MLIMQGSLLATEQRLKHFDRPLTYFSITDCVGSLFFGSPGIDKICKKAALQLNAIKRLARFMGSKERQVIVNSFILCHFNYCPLIWLFCSNTSQKKLEKVNERALRLALSDYTSSYKDLLVNAESTTIHIHSIRSLALEIYKTLHNLNPAFMKDYFLLKSTSYDLRRNGVLLVPKVNSTNYGIKSISFFLSPKIWNSLSNEIMMSAFYFLCTF